MQRSRNYNALITKTYAKTSQQLYSRTLEFAAVEVEIPVEAVPTEYLETKSCTAQLTRDEKCLL